MLLTDFLKQQAGKIGLQDNADLAAVLSQIGTIEIPDALGNQFNTGLMSLEGAKNNPALLNHFKPTILNAVDDQFKILAEKYGISDAMSSEKSTYKKAAILEAELARRLSEAESKSGVKETSAEITKRDKQIADLQTQLATLTDKNKADLASLQQQHQQEQLHMLMDFELGTKNFANKSLDKRVSVLTARTLLDEALKSRKAIVVNEDGVLKLKQKENPNMDYVDEGYKPVSFRDFTDRLLADNHLLEVSGGGGGNPAPTPPTPGGAQVSTQFAAAIQQAMGDATAGKGQ